MLRIDTRPNPPPRPLPWSAPTASTWPTPRRSGRKRRTWIPAGTRRSDAEKVLAAEIKRRHDGEPIPTEKLSLGQYLVDRWLPIQKSRVRTSTEMARMIVPAFFT